MVLPQKGEESIGGSVCGLKTGKGAVGDKPGPLNLYLENWVAGRQLAPL